MISSADAAALLQQGQSVLPEQLQLDLAGCRVQVGSNSAELLARLRAYFVDVLTDAAEQDGPAIEVLALERAALDPERDRRLSFSPWARDGGKP
ncbi:MAG: hypothetical protein HQL47_11675, partial [Gammaproteobacteria bacterium]|nr:hypothetical protein [Gammaproteobacteria bacterium]